MSEKTVEHKNAYFEDENGLIHKYNYRKLKNEESFASLAGVILYDNSGLLKLSPRRHETTPHFKEITGNLNRVIFCSDSQHHDDRITEITKQLNEFKKEIVLKIKTVKSSDYSFKIIPLLQLNNYLWNSEVVNTYDNDQNIRHDLSGFDIEGSQTKSKPKIIIEVIDTHFIDDIVYNTLIKRSLNKDLVIIFYILPSESKYNYINQSQNEMKVSCFIKNGKFYYGDVSLKKIENHITNETSNEYAEFNYVKRFVIDNLRKDKYVDLKMFEKSSR